jgi:phosphatidylserine/phosphatidylglycerophosphate/cardiolipin synthase-like enzyme
MGRITKARAYANNEVAFIAWDVDGMIDGCLGFDIVRIRPDGSEPPSGLATWVPFEGQRNPTWTAQDTGVWPVQKMFWRDLTLRRHRSDVGRRDIGFDVQYSIRPVGDMAPGLEPVPVRQPKAYDGPARPLGYLGEAKTTDPVRIDLTFGGVRATFTNGILSSQWLKHAIESAGKKFNPDTVRNEIANAQSPIRRYLTGDVLETLTLFLRDDKYKDGNLRLALYELKDDELVSLLIDNKDRIEVILSNTSKDRGGTKWDATNQKSRQALKKAGVTVHDRMFNNNHIGHNKFAVWRDSGDKPRAVMTGSTNWTSTGLCGQSNNALVVTSNDVATAYDTYWQRLLDDHFPAPKPPTAPGKAMQTQGPKIRKADQTPTEAALNGTAAQVWFSPNTIANKKGKDAPPDLAVLFDLIAKAQEAVFFLAFLPSRAGADSIISASIAAGKANKDLFVTGTISDVTAMPGYVAPDKKGTSQKERDGVKPYTFDSGGTHIVRAASLDSPIGDFEHELLRVGNAIVHDKIVVIDPRSPNCVVATGSHNLGFKASYENDENLIIFRGNQALAQAYAVHVLDVYDHYRFRAWQAKDEEAGKTFFEGHINTDDKWLRDKLASKQRDISRYFV